MVYKSKTGYLVLLFSIKEGLFIGLKFYNGVKNFSLENRRKTIFKNFQLLAKFCNAKVGKQIADAV